MTVAVAGNFMHPIKDLPYQLRVLLCGSAQNEPGSRYSVLSEQVKKSPVVWYNRGWQIVPVVRRETVREARPFYEGRTKLSVAGLLLP